MSRFKYNSEFFRYIYLLMIHFSLNITYTFILGLSKGKCSMCTLILDSTEHKHKISTRRLTFTVIFWDYFNYKSFQPTGSRKYLYIRSRHNLKVGVYTLNPVMKSFI